MHLKIVKTDEFLKIYSGIEDERNKQHVWHYGLSFKIGENATEMQKRICAVYGKGKCIKCGLESFMLEIIL